MQVHLPCRRSALLPVASSLGTPRLVTAVARVSLARQELRGARGSARAGQRQRRRSAAASSADVETPTAAADEAEADPVLRLELSTPDVQAYVRLREVRQGRGMAIVIASVTPGSEAAAAGVRVGQQVLEVSDPIRGSETWPVTERASLRYVREALRMRRAATLQLVVTRAPIVEYAATLAAEAAAKEAAEAAALMGEDDAAASGASMDGGDLLSAVVSAAEASMMSDGEESSSEESVARRLGEQRQRRAVELTALERRIQRRKERNDVESKRNDAPFFAGVALLFFLPPLIILLIASSSGYLDTLRMNY